jgi:methionyl-tRNA formyltransferase
MQKKLSKQDAQLDWQHPAQSLLRKIHAFNSANACFSFWHQERVKFFCVEPAPSATSQSAGTITGIDKHGIEVACGHDGSERLLLKEIQLPNAKRMPVAAVLNGKANYFQQGHSFKQAL